MNKIKILKALFASATTLLSTTPFLVSCGLNDIIDNMPKSINGNNWIGLKDGYFSDDDYTINHNNKTVTYTGSRFITAKNLVVPNYVWNGSERYRVMIGEECFQSNTAIEGTVELNDFMSEIPNYCFDGCKSIVYVIMHALPTRIGAFAFFGASSFETILIKSGLSFDKAWSTNLISIDVSAFEGSGLSGEFVGFNSLVEIKNRAFASCGKLTSVNLTFANQLQTIPPAAFYYCFSLSDVFMPPDIHTIGDEAFANCSILETIHLQKRKQELNLGTECFETCPWFKGFDKPITVLSCGEYAFFGDELLNTELWNQPNHMPFIPASAFANCSFSQINLLPPSVGGPENIDNLAFALCRNLLIIDLSSFKELPTWTGELIFQSCNDYGTVLVSEEVWNNGNVDQSWYDFLVEKQGLNMIDPEMNWHFGLAK